MGFLFSECPDFDRERLSAQLEELSSAGVYLGGSSWKYEGWLGQIYSRSRYLSRGRFSKKLFETTCLAEYSEVFPTVCADFSFYQFPSEEYFDRLFRLVPSHFRFAFKIPEEITCKTFPSHERYGPRAGLENESFLDAELLKQMFLRPLWRQRAQTAVLIFEFGAVPRNSISGVGEFVGKLDPFLTALPREFRYAVEVRNPEFLAPEYFECLRRHSAAHVYNAWTRMPELGLQVRIADSVTADFTVCRALLRRGRSYEQAVRQLTPYREVRDPNPEARAAMRLLIGRARDSRQTAFLFVNNRLEGNAPLTILSVVDPDAAE